VSYEGRTELPKRIDVEDERVKEDEDDEACRILAKRGWGFGFSYIKISAIVNRNRLRHYC
jgi:hypothetical protein